MNFKPRLSLAGMAAALALLAGCSSMGMHHGLTLSGAQEVPPVTTSASATGMIMIADDHTVSGKITTTGIVATMGHIHMAAAGTNGPVIVPFTQSGNDFMVPPGAKLTDAQYAAYKAGNLYVNVHSAEHKGGEIRVQLMP